MAGGAPYAIGWMNGHFVPKDEVRLPLLAPGVTYAASVFEGIRAYELADGTGVALFRLHEHVARLVRSASILGLDEMPKAGDLAALTVELLRRNAVREDCYVRLQVYVDEGGDMAARGPLGVAMLAQPRPQLLDRVRHGLRCQVSSWRRVADNASPPRVKAAANYFNGRLAGLQARADGYDTALLLTEAGHVAEAPGACVLLVRDDTLVAPPVTAGILESLTRDTVLTLAREHDVVDAVVERAVDRTELYAAAEIMLVGTGMEVTPVVGVDRFPVGDGRRGPRTALLQERYADVVRGRVGGRAGWLTPVAHNPETGS